MLEKTPFHARTEALCASKLWKDWAGFYAVRSYLSCHEPEYFAIRHAAGLIDVTPLFKYEVRGRDAAAFLSRLTVKDVGRLAVGRVTYLCWCDDDGKVVDDGTVSRLEDDYFRLTSTEPALSWLERCRRGFAVEIEDSSRRLGALALQGPLARDVLEQVAGAETRGLRFFGLMAARIDGADVWITRTGYTGDLGYEIWVERDDAGRVYDAVLEAGEAYGLLPAGLDAMDVTRVEAGFILNGVDYYSARRCLVDERKSSPYELGLGWAVQLERGPFVGAGALARERGEGSPRAFVGIDLDWDEFETVFAGYGLPPEVPTAAWRDGRPVYDERGAWIGQATSGAWSPTLKKNLALGQVASSFAEPGTRVQIEVTAEYRRHRVGATVTRPQVFDPPRKRS